jgi:hypothetical protein
VQAHGVQRERALSACGSRKLGDEVVARLNPKTGEIENLEVMFFSTRLLRKDWMSRMLGYVAGRRRGAELIARRATAVAVATYPRVGVGLR